jgi:hypothetical protein
MTANGHGQRADPPHGPDTHPPTTVAQAEATMGDAIAVVWAMACSAHGEAMDVIDRTRCRGCLAIQLGMVALYLAQTGPGDLEPDPDDICGLPKTTDAYRLVIRHGLESLGGGSLADYGP